MKKWILATLLFSCSAFAQIVGPTSITAAQCAKIDTGGLATVGINVTGTWTGTLQPQGTILGQTAFNVTVVPSTSNTSQATITADGAYVAAVAGYSTFQLCGNTVASGTATVYLNGAQSQLNAAASWRACGAN